MKETVMRSPVRNEAETFHAVLWLLALSAAIAIASVYGGTWVGVGVLIASLLLAVVWSGRARAGAQGPSIPMPRTAGTERRILVVANETLEGDAVLRAVRSAALGGSAHVQVVCPALTSRLRYWTSDDDAAVEAAEQRLRRSLTRLHAAGITATGAVGDGDPLQAIEDALRARGADLIVISTHPAGRSNWLERGVVARATARFGLPVIHVVVDLESTPGASRTDLLTV
jgi:nucleotide-binding universal stress UspA family protein